MTPHGIAFTLDPSTRKIRRDPAKRNTFCSFHINPLAGFAIDLIGAEIGGGVGGWVSRGVIKEGNCISCINLIFPVTKKKHFRLSERFFISA